MKFKIDDNGVEYIECINGYFHFGNTYRNEIYIKEPCKDIVVKIKPSKLEWLSKIITILGNSLHFSSWNIFQLYPPKIEIYKEKNLITMRELWFFKRTLKDFKKHLKSSNVTII